MILQNRHGLPRWVASSRGPPGLRSTAFQGIRLRVSSSEAANYTCPPHGWWWWGTSLPQETALRWATFNIRTQRNTYWWSPEWLRVMNHLTMSPKRLIGACYSNAKGHPNPNLKLKAPCVLHRLSPVRSAYRPMSLHHPYRRSNFKLKGSNLNQPSPVQLSPLTCQPRVVNSRSKKNKWFELLEYLWTTSNHNIYCLSRKENPEQNLQRLLIWLGRENVSSLWYRKIDKGYMG